MEDSIHTAGFLLMVMWFTCVIFSHVSTSQPPIEVHKRMLLNHNLPPVEVEFSETSDNTDSNKIYYSQEFEKANPAPEPEVKPRVGTKRKRASSTMSLSSGSPPKQQRAVRGKRSRLKESKYQEDAFVAPEITPPTQPNATPKCFPYITKWNANTTYLMCSSVSQITPPLNAFMDNSGTFGEESSVPLIAFFIPPDCMAQAGGTSNPDLSHVGASSSYSEKSPSSAGGQVLQVTCQVVGLDFIPVSHT